jgi:hypothetical protein
MVAGAGELPGTPAPRLMGGESTRPFSPRAGRKPANGLLCRRVRHGAGRAGANRRRDQLRAAEAGKFDGLLA